MPAYLVAIIGSVKRAIEYELTVLFLLFLSLLFTRIKRVTGEQEMFGPTGYLESTQHRINIYYYIAIYL